jgi:hypothetical protein
MQESPEGSSGNNPGAKVKTKFPVFYSSPTGSFGNRAITRMNEYVSIKFTYKYRIINNKYTSGL